MTRIQKLKRWCHLGLCALGIHAWDEVSTWEPRQEKFMKVGIFCPICMKHYDYQTPREDTD